MAHQFENNTFVQRAPLENTHWLTDYRNDDNTGQNRSWLINEVWTEILRMPSYKILVDEYDCATMVGTSRVFSVQLWDRRNRQSSTYTHTMSIKTAGLIYSDEVEIVTTNDQTGTILMSPNVTLLGSEVFLSMV